ncbi:hypothetical protein niasHS_011331 [Heterodera schachtii]|uniref:BTB domain-containing protein n=2 Tax=Heterodera TaxID=34509 RepID=A0ABD2IMU8_HETSC
MLSPASEVFKTMFKSAQTPMTAGSAKDNPLVVTDVAIFAFNTMLRYIYTDNLDELDMPNLFSVFYAAKKYEVISLVLRCFDQIDKRAIQIFQSIPFLSINQQLLCDLLKRDQLMINDEIEIWEVALRWADNQCRKNGKEITGANRREMLGPALFNIRFPAIPHEDFSRNIVPSAVLTEDELINVYGHHSLPGEIEPIFPTKLRFPKLILKINNFSEFQKSVKSKHSSDPVFAQGLELIIKVSIDKPWNKDGNELDFILKIKASKKIGYNRSRKLLATFSILSLNGELKWQTTVFDTITSGDYAFYSFISIAELMNLDNGLYEKASDNVTLVIEITSDDDN